MDVYKGQRTEENFIKFLSAKFTASVDRVQNMDELIAIGNSLTNVEQSVRSSVIIGIFPDTDSIASEEHTENIEKAKKDFFRSVTDIKAQMGVLNSDNVAIGFAVSDSKEIFDHFFKLDKRTSSGGSTGRQ